MPVEVVLPEYLRTFADGARRVQLSANVVTVRDALDALAATYPGVVSRVRTEQGEVREHVNIFVQGESIRDGDGLGTRLHPDEELLIVPAVSGG